MKKIATIDSFCDTEEKIKILMETITKLKDNGIDVMCISPNFLTLPESVIKKCDYVFYTKDNPILKWPIKSAVIWQTRFTDRGLIKMNYFTDDYHWAALYQVKKINQIALTFDYDIFYHVSYDLVVDDNILNAINNNVVDTFYRFERAPDKRISLHFMCFSRNLIEKIVEEIQLDEFIRTMNDAEFEMTKWVKKFDIKIGDFRTDDRIYLYRDINFFNHSKSNDYKMYMTKNQQKDENIYILFYDIKNKGDITVRINGKNHNLVIKEGEERTVEYNFKWNEIKDIQIIFNSLEIDYTEYYKELPMNIMQFLNEKSD